MKLPTRIPKKFQPFFWDVDAAKINPSRKPLFVIQRLLDWNNIQAARWVLTNFPARKIKETLTKMRGWSKRSLDFWSKYFNIPKEQLWTIRASQNLPAKHWNY